MDHGKAIRNKICLSLSNQNLFSPSFSFRVCIIWETTPTKNAVVNQRHHDVNQMSQGIIV